MIPFKILALFDFIDYLDKNKSEFAKKLPLCDDINSLTIQRQELNPYKNYKEKQQYDNIQNQITQKFPLLIQDIFIPVSTKLKELGIWSGDQTYSSIWNNNIPAIAELKTEFTSEDIILIINNKEKYLSFRKETNSNFLCLGLVFSQLDEILKVLFDFFKDTTENEFESFETKTIKVKSLEDAVSCYNETKVKNIKFSIPSESLFNYYNLKNLQPHSHTVKNEIIMGDKFELGDITNNSGQIILGKDIRISDSFVDKNQSADKIKELISLIRQEQNINDEQKQSLITNFDKVKEEILEEKPNKSKIFNWLRNTKMILENLVLTHDVIDTIHWIYNNLNFIIH